MGTYKGIKGFKVESLGSDPTLIQGDIWYNTASNAYKYTANVGAWATGTAYPVGLTYWPGGAGTATSCVVWKGYGGDPPGPGYIKYSNEFNGTAWSNQQDLNSNVGAYQSGFGTETAAVAGGGYTSVGGTAYNSTEEYNGVGWTSVNNMLNTMAMRGGVGTQTAGIEYGGAPMTTPPPSNLVEEYDGTNWTVAATLTNPRTENTPHTGGSQTAAMAVGGSTPPQIALVEEYNGTGWTERGDINTPRSGMGGSGTTASMIVYGGNPVTGVTESWDGSAWTEIADLATARYAGASAGTTSTSALAILGGPIGPPSAFGANVEEWTVADAAKTVTTS